MRPYCDGHARADGVGGVLMGSVAEKVMRKARCPVLTVKSPLGDSLFSGKAAPEAVSSSASATK